MVDDGLSEGVSTEKDTLRYDAEAGRFRRTKGLSSEDTQDPLGEVGVGGNLNILRLDEDGGGWRLDENWFVQYARRFASSHGYEIDESFASESLAHVQSRNVEEDRRYSEAEAIEAVKKIVTAAIEHSPGTNVLTAESFRFSLSDLCPLWPLCR